MNDDSARQGGVSLAALHAALRDGMDDIAAGRIYDLDEAIEDIIAAIVAHPKPHVA